MNATETTTIAGPAADEREQFVRRNLRRNIAGFGLDFTLYIIGISFATQATVVVAFAAFLGAPTAILGAIPAFSTIGRIIPGLFVAHQTQSRPRKMPYVVYYTIGERMPYLILAVLAFAVASWAPIAAVGILVPSLFLGAIAGGAVVPPWMYTIGQTIPTKLRGRTLSISTGLGSAGGLVSSAIATRILADFEPPLSYGICFAIASAILLAGIGTLLLVREPPPVAAPPSVPVRAYFARIPALLRQDPNLSWYLVARTLTAAGQVGIGFFTVYALRGFGAPAWQVGVFTTFLLAGNIAGNLAMGWVADQVGNRVAIMIGMAAVLLANLNALAAPSIDILSFSFLLMGINQASMMVSQMAIMLEFAPRKEESATYIGIGQSSQAPVTILMPIVSGVLADRIGLNAIFVLAAAMAATAFTIMLTRVRDPRHLEAAPTS